MANVAVCLSGCGFLDGAEIHESVLTLLALDQAGANIICCAPNIDQASVINHVTQSPAGGTARNVLQESARIARTDIKDISQIHAADLDAVAFPGGFGAAKNLSNFADKGPECSVHPEVERLIVEMLEAGKPICAICIAPAMLARVVGRRDLHPKLTIGNDSQTASALEAMGVEHVDCAVTDCVIDEAHRIVSTPAYMLGRGPAEVNEGIKKAVEAVLKMVQG
jgi:enhancing lycopene biosynthesis protein 2